MMGFAREYTVKAIRKPGRCDACGRNLEAGSSATRWAGLTDGEFGTAIYHTDCRQAEVAINHLHGTFWDEWQSLSAIDDEDRPWLRSEFPSVAERMFGPTPPDAPKGPAP